MSVGLLVALTVQWAYVARFAQALFLDGLPLASQGSVLLGLLAALAARALLGGLDTWQAAHIATRIKGRLRRDLTHRLLSLGPVLGAGGAPGAEVTRLHNGVEKLGPYYARFIPQTVRAGVTAFGLAGLLVALDPLTGLIVCLTGPLVLGFMVLIGMATRRASERQWQELERLGGGFADSLRGLAELRLFGRVPDVQEGLARTNDAYRRTTLRLLRVAFLSGFVLELAATLSTALVAVTVGIRLFEGHLPFERALFVLLLTPEFYAPLRQLGADHHAALEARVANETLAPLVSTPLTRHGSVQREPTAPTLTLCKVGLELSGNTLLEGVSFEVASGSRVALVGPSGAGKTSVLQVLLGVAPITGEVLVDGLPLETLEHENWLTQVALVSQHPYLLHGTVAENLRLARPGASNADLKAALADAGADFVDDLPDGLGTVLAEGGASLSGGERAKLSLARALLRDTPLWLLDEPTAHLDPLAEAEVRAVLERTLSGRTVVMATHRLEALGDFDRVVRLEAGRVVAVTPLQPVEQKNRQTFVGGPA